MDIRKLLREALLREARIREYEVDWDLYDQMSELKMDMMSAYLRDLEQEKPEKGAELNARQHWNTLSIDPIRRVWAEYMKHGYVPDRFHKLLYQIENSITINILKLNINTELAGHTPHDPISEWKEYLGEETPEEQLEYIDEFFSDWILDDRGQWRISDYALKPLNDKLTELRNTGSPERKLAIIDQIFEIAHMRGDVAAFFVTGGSDALSALSGYDR